VRAQQRMCAAGWPVDARRRPPSSGLLALPRRVVDESLLTTGIVRTRRKTDARRTISQRVWKVKRLRVVPGSGFPTTGAHPAARTWKTQTVTVDWWHQEAVGVRADLDEVGVLFRGRPSRTAWHEKTAPALRRGLNTQLVGVERGCLTARGLAPDCCGSTESAGHRDSHGQRFFELAPESGPPSDDARPHPPRRDAPNFPARRKTAMTALDLLSGGDGDITSAPARPYNRHRV